MKISRRHMILGGMAAGLPLSGIGPALAAAPADAPAPLNGEALLITFPDYPISTEYGYVDFVGHAGALLIGAGGLTKYHEFGRYNGNMKGETRNRTISNVSIDAANGKATAASLKKVFGELSRLSGQNGRMRAAYFINMDFDKMAAAATRAQPDYSVASHNCGHYARSVISAGNDDIDHPCIANPTPNNIVDEYIEEKNAEVLFDPATGAFSIGEGDEGDAKGQTLALC